MRTAGAVDVADEVGTVEAEARRRLSHDFLLRARMSTSMKV